jgi:hypothetical protein
MLDVSAVVLVYAEDAGAASKGHRCRLTIGADSRKRMGSQQAASALSNGD